ncbi:MAG: hypothetical protein FJ288_02080 [Planctomycetes bacterium]|nr:hypothetical protein [Planctomycetota bacterium]
MAPARAPLAPLDPFAPEEGPLLPDIGEVRAGRGGGVDGLPALPARSAAAFGVGPGGGAGDGGVPREAGAAPRDAARPGRPAAGNADDDPPRPDKPAVPHPSGPAPAGAATGQAHVRLRLDGSMAGGPGAGDGAEAAAGQAVRATWCGVQHGGVILDERGAAFEVRVHGSRMPATGASRLLADGSAR